MNLPDDSLFVLIREDSPTFRAGLPDFWGGAGQASTYPSVVALRRAGTAGATQYPRQRLSKDWMLYVRDVLNSHDKQAVNIIFKVEAGWINGQEQIDPWAIETMAEDAMPKPEFIISSGSFATIKERNSVGVLLDTFKLTDKPDAVANFENAGTRIVHFMAGHKDGYYVNITSGSTDGLAYDTYFPLIAPGDAWVHYKDDYCDNRIEFLPALPRNVRTNATLSVREYPSVMLDNVIDQIPAWNTVTIDKYFPSPTGVWGRTQNGWIALMYQPFKGFSSVTYFTDWNLVGLPALRPKHVFIP